MTSSDTAQASLKNLLGKLERKADTEYAQRTFTGRALSQNDNHLHVATEQGVVAIPLSEIQSVNPFSKDQKDIVAVTVKNADAVVALMRMRSALPGLGDVLGGGVFGNTGDTVTGFSCLDTCTVTGGPNCDATDDTFGCRDTLDDWLV